MQHSAGGKEQQALEQGVVHCVVEAGGDAQGGAQAHSRQHIADLGDAVEGQQTLEVVLGQCHGHADEHAHAAEEHQHELNGSQAHALEQEVAETDDAVDAGLGQNAGDQHRDGGGSRAVGVRRQGVEGYDKGLGAKADEQQRKGKLCGVIQVAGDQRGQLGKVQGMYLGVEHDGAHQDAGGAHGADHQILERRFQRALGRIPESGKRHCREGEDLHHDKHVEDIAGEDKTHNAAGEHEKQRVILTHIVVVAHILDGVYAGDEHSGGDQQAEEQAQGIHLKGDADGIAAGRGSAAHPVGDDLAVDHHRLYQRRQEAEGRCDRQQGENISHGLVSAQHHDQEGAQEKHHDGIDGEVLIA